MWKEYRRIKKLVLILVFGWLPFGFVLGQIVPQIFGTFVPAYALAMAYVLFLFITWLRYCLYLCPRCGTSFRGRQIYRKNCLKCGLPINVYPEEQSAIEKANSGFVELDDSKTVWLHYRKIKLWLLVLISACAPMIFLSAIALPVIFGSNILPVILILVYCIFLCFCMRKFYLTPCPNCRIFFGWRVFLYRHCGKCGIEINKWEPNPRK